MCIWAIPHSYMGFTIWTVQWGLTACLLLENIHIVNLIWIHSFWRPLLVCSITLPIGIYQGEQTLFSIFCSFPNVLWESICPGCDPFAPRLTPVSVHAPCPIKTILNVWFGLIRLSGIYWPINFTRLKWEFHTFILGYHSLWNARYCKK